MDSSISVWDKDIISTFIENVNAFPEKIAIIYQDTKFTYRQLDQLSNTLAANIAQVSALPLHGQTLAVALERGIWPIVAFLAALKSGATYLPVDPVQPDYRLQYMLQDSNACLLLTSRDHRYRQNECLEFYIEDTDWNSPAGFVMSSQNNQKAYIMYTSGSSGEPKGVIVRQRGILRLVLEAEPFQFNPAAKIAQCSNIAFDASTFEIWGALLNGATLVIIPYETVLDSALLAQELRKQAITDAWFTVALFNQLATDDPSLFGKLNNVLVGGDALNPSIIKAVLHSATPPGNLWNGYGPTENTVFTTLHRISMEDCEQGSIPIGRPVSGTQCYILDEQLCPVITGEPGELYTSGAGVSDGYLNKPDKTADMFLHNPFYLQERISSPQSAGKVLYRTGDRVRELPDGALEFLGRADNQVKIRGYRLEPGEIEQILCRMNGVSQAIVKVIERQGQKQLAAWCISDLPFRQIMQDLRQQVPAWMVPSSLQTLSHFPLTVNGKVDKNRLMTDIPLNDGSESVETETQRTIAEIWQVLLELTYCPGNNDDFFLLGGHSLLAVRVQHQIRQQLLKKVTLNQLFRYSELAMLAEFVDSLRREEDNALTQLHQPGQPVPLTPEQFCMWMDCQSEAESVKHHFYAAFRISGDFDPQRFETAVQHLVKRHDSLRLQILDKDGTPYQQVHDKSFHLKIVKVENNVVLQQNIDSLISRPFDFSQGSLMRMRLYQCHAGEWVLVIVFHHIIIDGWSMGNFYRELEVLYRGEDILEPLPVQFTDYCLWRAQQPIQTDISYWHKTLAGVQPLKLPQADDSEPVTQTLHFTLPASLHQRMQVRAEESHTGLYTLFYSALTLLLSRYCNQQEIPLSGIWANRPLAALEKQIGFFANSLILYTKVDEKQTVLDFLAHHHQQLMEGFEHGAAPLHEVLTGQSLPRISGSNPLCQVTLVLQNTGGGDGRSLVLPGCQIANHPMPPEPAKCALLFNIYPGKDDDLQVEIKVSQSQLSKTLIKNMPGHYLQLLEALSSQTGPLREISTVLPDEAAQLLMGNASDAESAPGTVLSHFLHQVKARPNSVAVRYLDDTLSWIELERLSDALAWQLRTSCGELHGERIVIALNRGLMTPVAMLAVIKTGAAYVPFDVMHPVGRLLHILKDSAACCVIVEPDSAGLQQICPELVLTPEILSEQNGRFNPATLSAEDILNVIYTSGSTGEPKGVMVRHKGIVRLAINGKPWHVAADAVMAQVSNISFDVSSLEIWGALLNGACLVIIPYETLIDSKALLLAIKKYRITDCTTTVALFNQLAEEAPGSLGDLRNLIIGGESPNAQLLAKVLSSPTPPGTIWNAYGPTENSVITTMNPINLSDCDGGILSIGKSVTGTSCYVLSLSGQLQPAGVAGELYTSGTGVAAGYLNNPEKSAATFLPNPFRELNHNLSSVTETMYKTGDLVYWREDGSLVFLGRTDNQIKIRGFRLEPDEVAQQLCRLPEVTQAIVTKADSPVGAQLIAWCVSPRTSSSILQELRGQVPSYMVPATLHVIECLPLTPNGKVDLKCLIESAAVATTSEGTPCVTDTERELAAIWSLLLNITQPIYREHNFFELGGHSLLVIKMVSFITERLGKTVEVELIFKASSLAELADIIEGKQVKIGRDTILDLCEKDSCLPQRTFLSSTDTKFHTLLITGATGFLGIHLLAELQQQLPTSRIICLVRSQDKDAALTRLYLEAERYQLSLRLSESDILIGDLNHPRLGLDEGTWNYLSEEIDAIYHCGAFVNHLHNYSMLRRANVVSTLDLLSLCQQGKAKQMFYISTLSTAPQSDTHILENHLAEDIHTDNGYILSKWVSEKLMMQAFQQGLKGGVYRVGNVTGSQKNGVSNIQQNHALNVIKGCLQLGVAPNWSEWTVDFSPVDLLARMMVDAGLQQKKLNEIVNLGYLTSMPWKMLLSRISEHESIPLRFISPQEWVGEWLPKVDSSNAIYPFKSFYFNSCDLVTLEVLHSWVDEFSVSPNPDYLLNTYLRFWKKIGFFGHNSSLWSR